MYLLGLFCVTNNVKEKTLKLRWSHTGWGWALNRMSGILLKETREDTDRGMKVMWQQRQRLLVGSCRGMSVVAFPAFHPSSSLFMISCLLSCQHLDRWVSKICRGLYSLFSFSLKPALSSFWTHCCNETALLRLKRTFMLLFLKINSLTSLSLIS